MKFKVGDIVEVVSVDAFYHKALGEVAEVNDDEILVYFKYIDMDTEEEVIYEECEYYEDEIKLIHRGE